MSKPLPLDDFRAVRVVLEPGDFGSGSDEPESEPTDLIPEDNWQHLVTLPDDVSVRTSAHFGTLLKNLSELQHEFVCVVLAIQDSLPDTNRSPMAHAASMICDDFQSSIYNALTGYYRLAFTALRSVVENTAIGMQLELSTDHAVFAKWLSGEELKFGWAADQARSNPTVGSLEAHFQREVNDQGQRTLTC